MKRAAYTLFTIGIAFAAVGIGAGCAPSHVMTEAEIPSAKDLGDVMWSQAKVADPAFKKIGASAYTDEDYAVFTAASRRLAVTTAKIEQSFSKGPAFNALAEQLAAHARELGAASDAKDAAAARAALVAMRDTCRTCHKQFR